MVIDCTTQALLSDRGPLYMSEFTLGLRCLRCGREYDAHGDLYVCDCRPNVGSDIGSLDVLYDYRVCVQPYRREA